MAKGTPVEAIPRDEIPEALGEIQWAVLQKTAKQTLGLNPIQKRAALESAIQVELGRAEPEPEPVLDPVGDTGEAGDAGIPEPPPVPQFDASALAGRAADGPRAGADSRRCPRAATRRRHVGPRHMGGRRDGGRAADAVHGREVPRAAGELPLAPRETPHPDRGVGRTVVR